MVHVIKNRHIRNSTKTDIGFFKRVSVNMNNGKSQCFIQMGVPPETAPNIQNFRLSEDEFKQELQYFQRKGRTFIIYTFVRRNV